MRDDERNPREQSNRSNGIEKKNPFVIKIVCTNYAVSYFFMLPRGLILHTFNFKLKFISLGTFPLLRGSNNRSVSKFGSHYNIKSEAVLGKIRPSAWYLGRLCIFEWSAKRSSGPR